MKSSVKNKVEFEFSSGGVVIDNKKVLVIKTKNLAGENVWTFPKGHIEKKENSKISAIREVEEETGYKCEIVRLLDTVKYWFRNGNRLVKKTVKWFLMKPIKKIKEHDKEVLETKWLTFEDALKILSYKSDQKLVQKLITHYT